MWSTFEVVNLTHNHRQGSEKSFADLLNRIRVGEQSEDDIKVLNKRVRLEDDPEVENCSRICAKVNEAVEYNKKKINELPGQLFTMPSRHFNSSMKKFKPNIDKSGRIGNTQFLDVLHLKVGARVMLIYNIGK